MNNEITAYFKGRMGIAESVYQNDYGIVLIFDGIELPTYFNCYFDTGGSDEEISGLGYDNRVVIPNSILARPGKVLVHIPYTDANKSRVEYVAGFNVIERARPADYGTPAQMTAIEQALAMLQAPITNIEDIVNAALAFTGATLADLQSDNDDNKTAISALTSRMNSFTRLAEGSTTGDAELIDGRIGANGTTYSDIGTAIRTQVSNLISSIANSLALDATRPTILSAGTDYNSLVTPGNYRVQNATAAKAMINCPTTAAHRLYVLQVSNMERIIQWVQANSADTAVFMRYYNGSAWGEWNRLALVSEVENAISAGQENLSVIPTETDYNSLTTVGAYQVSSRAAAMSMVNCPTEWAHRLYVTTLYTGSSKTFQVVIESTDTMVKYVRVLRNGSWSEWSSSENKPTPKYTPLYSEVSNGFSLNVSRIKMGGITVHSTMPLETRVLGHTDYYEKGAAVPSVVYSSVWRDGLDVYRNLTLETFYSALANPASVLYTKDYTSKNIVNAHALYGGVCSTYVTKVLGIRQYKTTAQLEDFLEPKPFIDYHDIAVGDALLKSGHIAFISQLYIDDDGALNGIGVSEQTSLKSAGFRTQIIAVQDFAEFLEKDGYTVMTPKEAAPPVTLEDPRFNAEIIFERGNNTYITEDDISEGAWFYIPNADTIYYKKDDGEFTSVDVSSLTTDTVNEVTVYDLSDCFDGVGDYIFTDDTDAVKMCLIKVIDVGNISLSGNTLTLSGWENCVPYNYYIVKEGVRTSEDQSYAMNPSEGYFCLYTNKCGGIDVAAGETTKTVVIPAADLEGCSRYKIWVEYATGIGYKQAFSNLVIL